MINSNLGAWKIIGDGKYWGTPIEQKKGQRCPILQGEIAAMRLWHTCFTNYMQMMDLLNKFKTSLTLLCVYCLHQVGCHGWSTCGYCHHSSCPATWPIIIMLAGSVVLDKHWMGGSVIFFFNFCDVAALVAMIHKTI